MLDTLIQTQDFLRQIALPNLRNGHYDIHMHPGTGNVNFVEMFRQIDGAGIRGPKPAAGVPFEGRKHLVEKAGGGRRLMEGLNYAGTNWSTVPGRAAHSRAGNLARWRART